MFKTCRVIFRSGTESDADSVGNGAGSRCRQSEEVVLAAGGSGGHWFWRRRQWRKWFRRRRWNEDSGSGADIGS